MKNNNLYLDNRFKMWKAMSDFESKATLIIKNALEEGWDGVVDRRCCNLVIKTITMKDVFLEYTYNVIRDDNGELLMIDGEVFESKTLLTVTSTMELFTVLDKIKEFYTNEE